MVSILIIGGGIGGLSVARELALRGMKATVLERAPQLNPVGAGIIMNPNAMGVLERNGLADQVRADSWPYLQRETRDREGRLLATRDYRPLYESGKLAQGCLVHRAHLLDVLYRSLPAGTVQFGTAL
jgi:2-polyprenyl-6-methoxyphenol hydroxylase-like FAD-dependent oxidoreductase